MIYRFADGFDYTMWASIGGTQGRVPFRCLAGSSPEVRADAIGLRSAVVVPATDADIAAWMEAHPEAQVVSVREEETEVAA